MDKVTVAWTPSETRGIIDVHIDNLGVSSIEEWESLSYDEKEEKLIEVLSDMPEQPYMFPDSWWVKDKFE